MLPAAFGRCDLGHLMMASPALLLGVAAIESWRPVRKVWSAMAIWLVVVPIFGSVLLHVLADNQLRRHDAEREDAGLVTRGAEAGCPVVYRAFDVIPKPTETSADVCLDTGYYYKTINAFTPEAVDRIVSELRQQPARPLLLLDKPLGEQFRWGQESLKELYLLELSPWVPKARNKAFSFQEVTEAIVRDYTPAAEPVHGFRVWYPKSATAASGPSLSGRHLAKRD
jgi:hypothetical protein